jgi:RimJ/RimL family protein N-acetyltransferase
MAGFANFHGPPGVNTLMTPGAAEMGYTVFAAHRGNGYATEVAQAMMDWAASEHGVTHFTSGVAPDNAPSLRVNDKLGFVRTGDVVDGEVIFELRRR